LSAEIATYKSVFISDTHLGSRGSNAKHLNIFLDTHTSDNLFLVGDIIDGWRLEKTFYWPEDHSKTIEHLLNKSRNGTHVYYLLGNHDESVQTLDERGVDIEEISMLSDSIDFNATMDYLGIDGNKYLVCHGDMFDTLMTSNNGRRIMLLGTVAYDVLLHFHNFVNGISAKLRLPYVNLTGFAKRQTKSICNKLLKFENRLIQHANIEKYDGVICGHIHTPEIKNIDNTIYMNCGDWVENCSALVEHLDGKWEILDWGKSNRKSKTSINN
jgi:UDP-2,3-diacylglucosamine pyrophosphatase LpxH